MSGATITGREAAFLDLGYYRANSSPGSGFLAVVQEWRESAHSGREYATCWELAAVDNGPESGGRRWEVLARYDNPGGSYRAVYADSESGWYGLAARAAADPWAVGWGSRR